MWNIFFCFVCCLLFVFFVFWLFILICLLFLFLLLFVWKFLVGSLLDFRVLRNFLYSKGKFLFNLMLLMNGLWVRIYLIGIFVFFVGGIVCLKIFFNLVVFFIVILMGFVLIWLLYGVIGCVVGWMLLFEFWGFYVCLLFCCENCWLLFWVWLGCWIWCCGVVFVKLKGFVLEFRVEVFIDFVWDVGDILKFGFFVEWVWFWFRVGEIFV